MLMSYTSRKYYINNMGGKTHIIYPQMNLTTYQINSITTKTNQKIKINNEPYTNIE